MEAELRGLLTSDSGVTQLVPAAAILWDRREGVPAIALWLISDTGQPTMSGPAGIREARVQVDCWASTADAAHDIGEAVVRRLDGARGELIRGAFLLNRTRTVETDTAAPGAQTPSDFHRTRLDLRVWHRSAN